MKTGRVLATLAVVLAHAATARAEPPPEAAGPDSDFWSRASDPGAEEAQKLTAIAVATLFAEGDDAKKLADAEAMLGEAATLSPETLEATFWLGIVRHRRGDARGCAAALGQVVTRDADFAPADAAQLTRAPLRYRYALCLAEAGDLTTAERQLERLFAAGPVVDWRVLFLRGQIEMASGKVAAAVHALRAALRLNPYHPALSLALAAAYDRSGQLSESRASALRAVLRDSQLRQLARARIVPAADRHYYAALGHIAGDEVAQAIIDFRHYLATTKTPMWNWRVHQRLAALWATGAPIIAVLDDPTGARAKGIEAMVRRARGRLDACVAKTPQVLLHVIARYPERRETPKPHPIPVIRIQVEDQLATASDAIEGAVRCTTEVVRGLPWPRARGEKGGGVIHFYVLAPPPGHE